MKKLFLIIAAVMMAVSVMAEIYPTKFLGIPVDGTKQEMIQKLKAKGFMYHNEHGEEFLTGEFNGSSVHIFIDTNNNKVYRIMVAEANSYPEKQIRIRYNNLMQQFNDNKKYVSAVPGQTFIPSDEDISYEMTVHNKTYNATYVQITHDLDTTIVRQDMSKALEEIPVSLASELDAETLAAYCIMRAVVMQYENNMVWFTISEFKGEYYLSIYYDNLYNQANGEDL